VYFKAAETLLVLSPTTFVSVVITGAVVSDNSTSPIFNERLESVSANFAAMVNQHSKVVAQSQ